MNYHNVQFETSFGVSAQLPSSSMPEIAFAGRSNVGKSSMINKLFNRKQLARVSAVPGKTATINFFLADSIRFVDLPGYGYAKVSKGEKRRWSELMEGYFSQERDLRLIFLLLDMRHPPSADDVSMANYLIETERPFAVVLTKADKFGKKEREERMQALLQELPYADQITMIPFSSKTGEGVDKIHSIIADIEEEFAEELRMERENARDMTEQEEGYSDDLED